jgi:hypothetical protein
MARNGIAIAPPADPPVEVRTLLDQARKLLETGQVKPALDLLSRQRGESIWITNAQAVCQLRLGNAAVALQALRELAVGPGGFNLRQDAPLVFKTNFAAALFLDGNVAGCLNTLDEIRDEAHPAVQKLRQAVRDWAAGLSFWQRLMWKLGNQPSQPPSATGTLGDL